MADLPPEQEELNAVRKQYQINIKDAKKTFEETKKRLNKNFKDAQKEFEQASQVGVRKVDRFGRINLFEDRIETPDGTAYFVNGEVKADVQAEGSLTVSQRPTVTRWACCGCFSLAMPKKKKIDTRQVFLTITAPGFGSLVKCPLPDSEKCRKFAINVNSTSQQAANKRAAREQALAQGSQQFKAAEEERDSGMKKAKEKYLNVSNDNARLNSAIEAAEKLLTESENKKLANEVNKAKKILSEASLEEWLS